MNSLHDILDAIAEFLWYGDFFSEHRLLRLLCLIALIAAIAIIIFLIYTA